MDELFKLLLVVAMFGSAIIDVIGRVRKSRSRGGASGEEDVEAVEDVEDVELEESWRRPVPPIRQPPAPPPVPPSVPMATRRPSRAAAGDAKPTIRSYDDLVEAAVREGQPRSLMPSRPMGAPRLAAPVVERAESPRDALRRALRTPATIRQAVLLSVVLGPPPGLSGSGAESDRRGH